MKKRIFKTFALALVLCGGMSVTSCSDPDDVQDLVLDRVLSPTGITARVSENVNIIVTWNAMEGATSYELEAYADSPDYDQRTPDVSATTTETTYTLTNLIGETDYYIRVRALDENDESRNSKWVEVTRTTNPEQNMNSVNTGDIQSTAVRLTWTAGIEVDAIVCTPTANTTLSEVTYQLTEEDIASGSATVTGLEPETTYRATLKLGEKTRGYATFVTNLDLRDATQLDTSMDWVSAIQNATAGSKFALAPGTYNLTDAKLQINSDVVIGAQNSADQPVLNTCIHMNNGASLHLYQVVLDGTGTDGSQAIDYKTSGSFGALTIEGCEVKNYTKGFIYNNISTGVSISSITIKNCIIHDIPCQGGELIDMRTGGWSTFSMTESTLYNCSENRCTFRYRSTDVILGLAPVTTINHCTFHNCGSDPTTTSNNQGFLSLEYANNSTTFTNNIVSGTKRKTGFTKQSAVNEPTFRNNFYYDCLNLTSLAEGNTETVRFFDEEGTVLEENPFADPDNADFTITDELLQSYEFGDPRWR